MNVLVPVMFENVREPLVDTEPASVSVADVALFEFHVTVVEPPKFTVLGFAKMEQLGVC